MSNLLKALQRLENRENSPPSDPAPTASLPAAPASFAPPPAADGLALVDSLLETIDEELLVELDGAGVGQELVGMFPATDTIDPQWNNAVSETAFLQGPIVEASSLPAATETRTEEPPPVAAAEEPVEEPSSTDVPQQYYELAANMAEAWDLPVAIALVGGTAGRSHEAVGLSLAVAIHELLMVDVLVVDGDFREPAFAPGGDEPKQGLAELISGAVDCRQLAAATMYPGVHLLVAHWDAAARESPDFERLLEACTNRFPVVIVVAPPLDDPCAIPLAAACDGTYLVVRLGYVSDRTARYLTTHLRAAGARLVGAVALAGE